MEYNFNITLNTFCTELRILYQSNTYQNRTDYLFNLLSRLQILLKYLNQVVVLIKKKTAVLIGIHGFLKVYIRTYSNVQGFFRVMANAYIFSQFEQKRIPIRKSFLCKWI